MPKRLTLFGNQPRRKKIGHVQENIEKARGFCERCAFPESRLSAFQPSPKPFNHKRTNVGGNCWELIVFPSSSLAPGSVDLLCLPEMIFTGEE
jgi:hypothetical protein